MLTWWSSTCPHPTRQVSAHPQHACACCELGITVWLAAAHAAVVSRVLYACWALHIVPRALPSTAAHVRPCCNTCCSMCTTRASAWHGSGLLLSCACRPVLVRPALAAGPP
jgi:hypothetical protein